MNVFTSLNCNCPYLGASIEIRNALIMPYGRHSAWIWHQLEERTWLFIYGAGSNCPLGFAAQRTRSFPRNYPKGRAINQHVNTPEDTTSKHYRKRQLHGYGTVPSKITLLSFTIHLYKTEFCVELILYLTVYILTSDNPLKFVMFPHHFLYGKRFWCSIIIFHDASAKDR